MQNFRINDTPPSIYPEGADICDLAAVASSWFLFRATYIAKNPCTKRLALHLRAQDINYYLPLVQSVKKLNNGERRISLKPLFGPYLFAALRPGQFAQSDYIDEAKAIAEDWKLVPQLTKLKDGIDAGLIRSLADLKPGSPVRIKSGGFKGRDGTIDAIDYGRDCAFIMGLVPGILVEIEIPALEAV